MSVSVPPDAPITASVAAIVPMKPLSEAKTRLSDHLDPTARARLSAAMLDSTLAALRDSAVARTVVVGGDECVKAIAAAHDSEWMADRFDDLNLAVGDAIVMAHSAGQIAMYVPADLPLVTANDVDAALRFAAAEDFGSLTICPAHDGGTNCLIVPSSQPFPPRLGVGSHARHRELAAQLGVEMREFRSPAFERDVDTIDDLRHCIERGASSLEPFLPEVYSS